MMYSDALVSFLKAWEGLKLSPSGDPLVSGVVDVGYGHVIREGEERRTITEEEADQLLRWDLEKLCAAMDNLILVALTQYQFDALLSWTYNLGTGALLKSTLLRCVNDEDLDRAAEEFQRWVNAGGKVAPGLVKRRAAERAMFEAGNYEGKP